MSDEKSPQAVPFSLEGKKLQGQAGDTLAAALLREGVTTFTRSIKYHRPRGPFCFAGTCGQCLVRVDGVPSLPACQVQLKAGMSCERQNAPLGLIDQDLFRAVDFIYPGGLDHHHLMIQSRLLGRVALEVARRLAGLGTLPDKALPAQAGSAREVPLAIIGAGPSGLAAARGAVQSGVAGFRPLLLETERQAGGASKLWPQNDIDPKYWDANHLAAQGIELQLGSEVIGLYADEQATGPALLAVRQGEKLLAVRARRVIVATGGASQPLPFPGNDRPGVYAARGLLELARRCGVRVGEGKPLALAGSGAELARCAHALIDRGYALAAMVAVDNQLPPKESLPPGVELFQGEIVRARGRPVVELRIKISANGKSEEKNIRCGAVAIAMPPAPLYDLASSCGAKADYSPAIGGFPLVIDANGRSTLPWLFAVGTAAGQASAARPELLGTANIDTASISRSFAVGVGSLAARESAALGAAARASLEEKVV